MDQDSIKHVRPRYDAVDIAKGIGIILVVLGHAFQGVVTQYNIGRHSSDSYLYFIKMLIYGFHMPLFVFISGLFISGWVRRRPKVALLQKVKSLVLPYFVWTVILSTFMQIGSSMTNNGLGFTDALNSWIVPFSEYWYLYFLFIVSIIYYLYFNIIPHGQLAFLVSSIIAAGVSYWVPALWIFQSLANFAIFFSLGTFTYKFLPRFLTWIGSNQIAVTISVSFIFINAIYLIILSGNSQQLSHAYWFLTSFIGILFIFVCSVHTLKYEIGSMLKNIGKLSLEIYVAHLIPLAATRILLSKVLHLSSRPLIVLVSMIGALVGVWVMLWLVKLLHIDLILFGRRIPIFTRRRTGRR